MFRYDPDPTFSRNIEIKVPSNDGFSEQSCTATFRILPVSESGTYDLSDGGASTEFLQRVVIDLGDLVDENDQPMPYTTELRDKLLAFAFFRTALARAYFSAISGNA
ncbi:MAG: hypothetical protein ABIV36_13755 [Sphingobium limneticum]